MKTQVIGYIVCFDDCGAPSYPYTLKEVDDAPGPLLVLGSSAHLFDTRQAARTAIIRTDAYSKLWAGTQNERDYARDMMIVPVRGVVS